MKRLFIFLLLFSLSFGGYKSYADDSGTTDTEHRIPKKTQPNIPGVCLSPSYSYISCKKVGNGYLFSFTYDIEYIDIAAENIESHVFYIGSVSVDNSFWAQPLPAGEYYIECTTDNGDIYAGYIHI